MLLMLHGLSAYRLWLRSTRRPAPSGATDARVLAAASPTRASVAYLREAMPWLGPTPHLLCAQNSRRGDGAAAHRSSYRYPPGSFLPVGSGVYAASPELTAVQLALRCPSPLLEKALCMLLGTWAPAPDGLYGTLSRPPLTDAPALGAYLAACPGLPGASALARALPRAIERVASPAEADLALALCLPPRLGGQSLPKPVANHRIDLSPRGRALARQRVAYVDLCWPDRGLVLEYDADLTHLNPEQHARDASRRAALESDGYKVITVTTEHLYGPRSLDPIADEAARVLGIRRRARPAGFRERQRALQGLPRGYDLPDDLFA